MYGLLGLRCAGSRGGLAGGALIAKPRRDAAEETLVRHGALRCLRCWRSGDVTVFTDQQAASGHEMPADGPYNGFGAGP